MSAQPHPDGGDLPPLSHLVETMTVDGIAGVPTYIVLFLTGPSPLPWRYPRFGKVLACGPVEFPAPYGERLVVFCEGGAWAWYPEETPDKLVQKCHWRDLPRIANALGVA